MYNFCMIIWLASYPKSGNTWLRTFLISLLSGKELNINKLNLIPQYPKEEYFKNITKDFSNIIEVSEKWIESQNLINSDKKLKFLKTHNMLCNVGENYFTNPENTLGGIYVVRDPRNVITSIKNHYQFETYEESLEFMIDENKYLGSKYGTKKDSVPTIIGSWGTNYNSWKIMKKNFILLKYEALLKETFSEFNKLSKHIEKITNFKFGSIKVKKAIESCSFQNLKKMEKKDGFIESPYNKITKKNQVFFNLGPDNNWEILLSNKIRIKIEKFFEKEMRELGYI